MDPEDLREVISSYQKCVAETVQRFGGFVAKYMGDGVLVYFGYPQAHEDDAERAIRAGLELIQAVGGLKSSAPLQTRVGIATGLVVVGDLIGSGEAQERGIVGETPNVAARLQSIAEPNGVVIAESTRKLLGNLFDLQELGAQDLKGIGGPVRAWAVLRPASVESRFEALHASGLTELVGREEELELLLRRWSKAKTGEGQVVLLSGEAGIGKSRLTVALLERLATEPHTRLRYFCSPQRTDSALYPVISQMERAAAFTHDDSAQAKLDKLDVMLAQTATSKQEAALFAEMLSLPNDGRFPALNLDPQQRRQKTLEALTAQMEALSRQNPVLMVFEDAHWTDPTSLEVLGRIVDRVRSTRVLLIVTFRSDFEPPWTGRPHVTFVTLNRLGERDVAAMIEGVVGNKPLQASIRQDIIERTDGIPLFVEEMTKAVLEAGGEDAARRTAAAIPSPALAVPASLQASLMARLDRLGPAKEVAQIGAAIGREFSHAPLAAVSRKDETQLKSTLDSLVQAGLLFRQGLPPHATYLFKHALVQDAAYGTLLRESRRALHARIAETLESQFAEIAENQPEVLARHCAEAGFIEKAIAYYRRAGEQCVARSAIQEAVAQFSKGLDQLSRLPETRDRQFLELGLQSALGNVLFAVKGFAAREPAQAYARVRELSELLGETTHLCRMMFGYWLLRANGGELRAARQTAEELLRLGERRNEPAGRMMGHLAMAGQLLMNGDYSSSRSHIERLLDLHDPVLDSALVQQIGTDAHIGGWAWLPTDLILLGYPDQARQQSTRVMLAARRRAHAPTLGWCLSAVCRFSALLGENTLFVKGVDEFAALAAAQNFPLWLAQANAYRGWISLCTGGAEEGVRQMSDGVSGYKATGALVWLPFLMSLLAAGYRAIGDATSEERTLDDALALANRTGEVWFTPELHRLKGLGYPAGHAEAERHFRRALEIARPQRSMLWQLRASTSLARLWRDQGKRNEACDLLAPVYGWFTEGFDTLDLKEAKALLEDLAA
jgi:class 3 adenylate cyclase/tetratricopeptide (TPR) repeat protein